MRLNSVKYLASLLVFIYIQSCIIIDAAAEVYTKKLFLETELSYDALSQQYESLSDEIDRLEVLDSQCSISWLRIKIIDDSALYYGKWLEMIKSPFFVDTYFDKTLLNLAAILNKLCKGGVAFSGKQGHGESPLSVNLDLVPVDFDVNQPISPFYIGHIDPSVIAIGDFHLTLDILSTDDVFENALRALMIIKTGRKNEHRELIDQLLTNARTKFEVTKQKAADYLERIESYQKELSEQSRCLKAYRDSLHG